MSPQHTEQTSGTLTSQRKLPRNDKGNNNALECWQGKVQRSFYVWSKCTILQVPHARNFTSRAALLRLIIGARLFPFHSSPGAASLFSGCADVAIDRAIKLLLSSKRLALGVGSLLLTTNLTIRMTTTIMMIIKTM